MAYPAAKSGFTLEDLTKMGPDEITRKRKIAEALLAQSQGIHPIANPLEGMAQMAQALIGNLKGSYLDRKEREGKEGANALFSAGMGMGEFPAAPGGGSPVAANDPYAGMADGSKGQEAFAAPVNFNGDIKSGIASTAQALGIDPVDLATAISYETGGTFDPTKGGPTTQWGKHRGLIQFGEPQAKQYGVDWNNPVGSQLGPDGAVAKYLRDTGVKPGMGMLDIYSAINAGGVGRYDRSDANNGGAPGTVRDKVEKQMAGHRAKAMAMFGGEQPAAGGAGQALEQLAAPAQVASLDPAIGVPPQPQQAAIGQALVEQGIDPNGPQAQAFAALQQGGGVPPPAVPGTPPAAQVPIPAPAAPQAAGAPPQQVQLAQALTGGQPDIGLTMGAPARQPGGPDINTLMNMAGNEFMSPQQQKLIEALTGQRMEREAKQADPAYQMGLEKSRLEIDALKNPRMSPSEQAQYDLNVQKFGIEQADRLAKQADTDADNRREDEKFDLDRRQANLTPGIKEYEAYKRDEANAGRVPLGRLEYEQALRKSGANNTSVSVGGGENKQVFDAVAASAEKAQAALTGFNAIQEANKALDSGIISGAGADMRLGLQKLGALFGADPTAIQNTETFRSAIAPQIASMIKATVGSANISNTDREFAEKAVGGNIELDAGSIKRLMGIMEKMGRETIKRHRSIVDKVYPEGQGFDRERALFGIDELPEVAAPSGGGESIDDIIKRNR